MSDAIRIGILGLGRAGYKMHLNELANYPERFSVVAGCDIEPDHCAAFEEKTGAESTTDIGEFLANKEIELVSVATRSPDHVAHAKRALEAGKFVFLEKPVAITLDGVDQLERLAVTYPKRLYFRHNRRFESGFQHIREIMAAGTIGDVFSVKLRRNGYQRRNDWQTIKECGGGQLNNWGPHIIDHGLRFLDSPLAAVWGDLKRIAAVGDAEDHLKVILTGENGRVVDLEISGGSAVREPEYLLFGSKGALRCDENEIYLKVLDPAQPLENISALPDTPPIEGAFGNTETLQWIEETFPVAPASGCVMHSIWKYLYEAIRAGKAFPVTIEEGLEVARVSCRIKEGTPFAMNAG